MLFIAVTDRRFTGIKNKTDSGQMKCTNDLAHIPQIFIKFTTYQALFWIFRHIAMNKHTQLKGNPFNY